MAAKPTFQNVEEYMAAVEPARLAALTQLRKLCKKVLKGYRERIEYGMPSYAKDEKVEVAFASQKQYISLYMLKTEVVNGNRELLAGLNVGKGCIRYTSPAKMDFAVIEKLLRATFESAQEAC